MTTPRLWTMFHVPQRQAYIIDFIRNLIFLGHSTAGIFPLTTNLRFTFSLLQEGYFYFLNSLRNEVSVFYIQGKYEMEVQLLSYSGVHEYNLDGAYVCVSTLSTEIFGSIFSSSNCRCDLSEFHIRWEFLSGNEKPVEVEHPNLYRIVLQAVGWPTRWGLNDCHANMKTGEEHIYLLGVLLYSVGKVQF
ncbi:hypothetical protein BDQ12DRAFT_743112 [Crucibulum laeve]|uniref:Uncharacterized protein n=1 Tax=Crucibulum laeve TaxID=68775 RepID=A0A5C3MUS5_9AGAR|nr:hypothetical protein BDQ12DRAFT_743112 [Crucibulum laeve]